MKYAADQVRTDDTRIFSPLLYQLSYSGAFTLVYRFFVLISSLYVLKWKNSCLRTGKTAILEEVRIPGQDIVATLLSLSPREASEVLKKLEEHELLRVGEAMLRYGHLKSHFSKENKKNITTSNKESVLSSGKERLSNVLDSTFLSEKMKQDLEERMRQEQTTAEPSEGQDAKPSRKEEYSFLKMVAENHSSLEIVRALYTVAFGKKRAEELIKKLIRGQLSNDFSFLHHYTEEQIYKVIHKEGPTLVSFVMEMMARSKAAKVLTFLAEQERREVITHMIQRKTPNIEACRTIRDLLRNKLKRLEDTASEQGGGGMETLVDIVSYLSFSEQQEVINHIEDEDIKKNLERDVFSWNLVKRLSSSQLQQVNQKLDNHELALLLTLKEEQARELVFSGLSKNRIELVKEEEDLLIRSPALLQQAEEVRERFFALAKNQLEQEDGIII